MDALRRRRRRLPKGGIEIGQQIARLRRRRSRAKTLRDLVPHDDLGEEIRERRVRERRVRQRRGHAGLAFHAIDETRPLGDESRKVDAGEGHQARVRVGTV